jgi:hypothetical protein
MIAIWAIAAASLLILIGVHVLYWIDAREVRRDTARFEMLGVRDRRTSRASLPRQSAAARR